MRENKQIEMSHNLVGKTVTGKQTVITEKQLLENSYWKTNSYYWKTVNNYWETNSYYCKTVMGKQTVN